MRLKRKWLPMAMLLTLASLSGLANAAEPLRPLTSPNIDPRKAALGKKLFEDKRLSGDSTVACVSCHGYASGTDNLPVSVGIRKQKGGINAPTIYNAANNFVQFWDGRAKTLEEQAHFVVGNTKEFDSSMELIVRKLSQDSALVNEFKPLYAGGLNADNVLHALADFERTLITPSRFDQYLQGNAGAISEQEKRGYSLFKNYGCVACHQGQNVGGNMFQIFGAMNNYFKERGTPLTEADNGRYNVTRNEADRYMFRVPSLRNVALTAPYFHDASAPTLEAAVNTMFKYQLGRSAPQQDKDDIVAFLKSLTGAHPLMKSGK
ncbi:MAG: cytochrome c peroxidase [Fluviicoccus sp.]|uniref:cytochrome-c peroxidase n=1 Tax=Fluviicoccus sp. TaxID=2003552 RepID=UPI00272042EE|nr:cytochrome c peroxidase [Fluviicoccus sp.]MDO8330951.1 cytochrome c peroxidase [Fluviicoccus sp.]